MQYLHVQRTVIVLTTQLQLQFFSQGINFSDLWYKMENGDDVHLASLDVLESTLKNVPLCRM